MSTLASKAAKQSVKIVVLAKQVPDTRQVGPEAMTPEGTVNRSALPAIFNPEDLNALEQALRLKETYPDATVTLLTMGPPRAEEVVREALYRGADRGFLLTDRAFAGADTLATSYALATAISSIEPEADLILGGRQAIDGDTAQVGPQVAEKLGLNQITYVEEILSCEKGRICAKRRIDGGFELVESPLPCVLTVNGSAAPCRPKNVRRIMRHKHQEIPHLSCAEIGADLQQCGLSGSPTKVKAIENIVFRAKESKVLSGSDEDIRSLIQELKSRKTI